LKPCIWSSYFMQLPIEEAIPVFLECGFTESELSDEHAEELLKRGNPEKTGKQLKLFADSLGFRFPQGHLKLFANICAEDTGPVIDELKRWLDLFCAIGIQTAVLHAGLNNPDKTDEELLKKRCDSLLKLTDYIKGTSMTICIENLPLVTRSSQPIVDIINCVGSERLGICLDTGHLNMNKSLERQYSFIENAGSRLKALHIADNEGFSDQHLMPYGKGNVDWTSVLRGLKKVGYDGAFSFEIPGESYAPFPILKEKLKYVRKIADYMTEEYNNA